MSKSYLNAKTRDEIGSNKSNHLRKNGLIPCVLFGGHMDSQAIVVEKLEFDKFLAQNRVGAKVYMKLDGKEVMTLLKEVQKDVFGVNVLHVDFQALTKDDKVKLHVRLHYIGKDKLPPTLIAQELVSELEIETLPENLIDNIDVDVSEVKFGDIIKVSDLPITHDPKIRVISDPNLTIFNLVNSNKLVEEEAPVEEEAAVAEKE